MVNKSKTARMDNPNLIMDGDIAYDKCSKNLSHIRIQMQAGF